MPEVPAGIDREGALIPAQRSPDSAPYLRIAADLRAAIACGALKTGDALPTVADLSTRYEVAPSTAHRAVADLASAGLVVASRGSRAKVADLAEQI